MRRLCSFSAIIFYFFQPSFGYICLQQPSPAFIGEAPERGFGGVWLHGSRRVAEIAARKAATKRICNKNEGNEASESWRDGIIKQGPLNAKTRRRRDAKKEKTLCAFVSLRLCVKNSAIIGVGIFAKMSGFAGLQRSGEKPQSKELNQKRALNRKERKKRKELT
jgi:hypothetical protein